MAETWVRPPLLGLEPAPRWKALWRFRLVTAAVLVLLVLALVAGYQELTGANAQDPGVSDTPDAPAPLRVPQLSGE